MAQVMYHAANYPNGTLLSSFDWAPSPSSDLDFVVTEIGATGRKYWMQAGTPAINKRFIHQNLYTDYEMLLLVNLTGAEISATTMGLGLDQRVSALNEGDSSFTKKYLTVTVANHTFNHVCQETTVSATKNVAPTGFRGDLAMGARIKITGGTGIKARHWAAAVDGLQAGEPATWDFEGTFYAASTPLAPAIVTSSTGLHTRISTISIGTGGDVAPYPLGTQTVTTPSGLSVSGITDTTANLDWT